MAQHFDITRHFRDFKKQGATIVETKSGYLIRNAAGQQVAVHRSHSGTNPHAFKRTVNQLAAIGLSMNGASRRRTG